MCFLGFSPSNSDGALFAQMGNRHLTLLPSKMPICAGRKALVTQPVIGASWLSQLRPKTERLTTFVTVALQIWNDFCLR
jgi:hypothetical protein